MEIREEDVNEKYAFMVCCGEDEDGNNNSIVSVKLSFINMEDETEDIIDEFILDNPVVNIFKSSKGAFMDLTFMYHDDYDFVNLVGRLNEFSKTQNSAPLLNGMDAPSIFVTATAKKYRGEWFAIGKEAVWCVMPSRAGRPNDTVRFLMASEDLAGFHRDIEDIDLDEATEKLLMEEAEEGLFE